MSERYPPALVFTIASIALIAGMLVGAWIYTDAIEERDAKIEKLQEENSAYADQVEQLEAETNQKEQRIDTEVWQNEKYAEKIDDKEQKLKSRETKIEQLESEIEQLEERITDVRVNNGEMDVDHVAVAECYDEGGAVVAHSVDEHLKMDYVSGENTVVLQLFDDRPIILIDDLSKADLETEYDEPKDWMCPGDPR